MQITKETNRNERKKTKDKDESVLAAHYFLHLSTQRKET